jgi:hypothetical protein
MKQNVRVLVFGLTALLEGIAICLEHDPNISLQQIQTENSDALKIISQFKPNAIIFQLGCPETMQLLLQIPALTGIHLIGLDAGRNQALMIESWMIKLHSMDEVHSLIMMPESNYAGVKSP